MLAPNKSQAISPIALPHVIGSSGSYVQAVIEEEVKKAVLKAALHNPEALVWQQMDIKDSLKTGYRGIFGGTRGSNAQQDAFNRLFAGVIAKDIVNAEISPIKLSKSALIKSSQVLLSVAFNEIIVDTKSTVLVIESAMISYLFGADGSAV